MIRLVFVAFVVIVLSFLAGYMLLSSDQEIDFSSVMPKVFELCDEQISENDLEYIALKEWFLKNKSGWKKTPVSYVQKYVYRSDFMTVNIVDSLVVVSYKSDMGWSQVLKTGEIDMVKGERKCSANKSIKPTPGGAAH